MGRGGGRGVEWVVIRAAATILDWASELYFVEAI